MKTPVALLSLVTGSTFYMSTAAAVYQFPQSVSPTVVPSCCLLPPPASPSFPSPFHVGWRTFLGHKATSPRARVALIQYWLIVARAQAIVELARGWT